MKRMLPKAKKHQISKSKKIMRQRMRRNKQNKDHRRKSRVRNSVHNTKKAVRKLVAPQSLSLQKNPESTLHYFKMVIDTIEKTPMNGLVFFDLSNIETVTVDAIMYLIATLKNIKRITTLRIRCHGNVPLNANAREVFESCGFYKYVKANIPVKNTIGDNIKITRGKDANPYFAGDICDFVCRHNDWSIIKTKSLYRMIIELMTNTTQHAYNKTSIMDSNWYVFAENTDSYISFIFLDTGEGIPNTIRTKGLLEKIKSTLGINDALFVSSALRGELRSATKLEYRGKGLPEIYNRAKSKYITDFSVTSGHAKCMVNENDEIVETNYSDELIGTMLSWKLNKD